MLPPKIAAGLESMPAEKGDLSNAKVAPSVSALVKELQNAEAGVASLTKAHKVQQETLLQQHEDIFLLDGHFLRNKEAEWEAQLARLAIYKAEHGDCSVPWGWAEDPGLSTWVNKQRKRKRRLDRGEPSEGMTAARAARLTAVGLVWDPPNTGGIPKEAEWEAQLARLAAYNAAYGDCIVPRCWAEDPKLGRWVDMQRTLKRRLDRGEPSVGMTAARAVKLDALGFTWNSRNAAANGKPASMAAKQAPAVQPPAGLGKRQRQAPAGTAAPFMQLLY